MLNDFDPERDQDVRFLPQNQSKDGTLPWAHGTADWVVALDVVAYIPKEFKLIFFKNAARFAKEGLILAASQGLGASSTDFSERVMEMAGPERDVLAEENLFPFTTNLRRWESLRVFVRKCPQDMVLVEACDPSELQPSKGSNQ